MFLEDCSDLSMGRPDLVSRHPELHFPAVHLCAKKLGRSGGDHLCLLRVDGVDAEAETMQGTDQQLSMSYTLLVRPAEQN